MDEVLPFLNYQLWLLGSSLGSSALPILVVKSHSLQKVKHRYRKTNHWLLFFAVALEFDWNQCKGLQKKRVSLLHHLRLHKLFTGLQKVRELTKVRNT